MSPSPLTSVRVGRVSSASPWVVATVAVLVLAVAAVVGFTQGRGWFAQRDQDQASADALSAGRQLAVNFTTLDYRHVDQDTQRVLDGATGTFHDQFAKAVASLKKVVVDNKSVSSVKTVNAAVVSADADSARVIVGVVAPTSNASTPQPVDKTYRMRLDLERSGSSWKVSNLDFVG